MRFKQKMIAIDKRIRFYFLQNVWKFSVFWAYAFRICKKCSFDLEFFVLQQNQLLGMKNELLYANFKFVEIFRKKIIGKKLCEFLSFAEFALFANVFACNFTKICGEILAVGHIGSFSKFWMQMPKTGTFSNILQKRRKYSFANIYQSQFDSLLVLKIEGP